jgi:hypothetical protein
MFDSFAGPTPTSLQLPTPPHHCHCHLIDSSGIASALAHPPPSTPASSCFGNLTQVPAGLVSFEFEAVVALRV